VAGRGPLDRAHDRLLAAVYDPLLAGMERAGLGEARRHLLADARGRTVEIGAGTGVNLAHLPLGLPALTLVEPSDGMRTRLTTRLEALVVPPAARVAVVAGSAADLPFSDSTIDTVVSTLVLCSVPDPGATARELHRVLAPDGRLLLLEHVLGAGRTRTWQRTIDPVWRIVARGCRLVRDTRRILEDAGFDTSAVADWRLPGGGITGPALLGTARPR
jgi:SAM-dependent methyltransferase